MAEANATLTEPVKSRAIFASLSLLMEDHSALLQREPDFAPGTSYIAKVQEFFARAQATGAILELEDERRTAQSILNYWITVLYRANVSRPDETTLATYDPTLTLDFDTSRCPYPGVRAFHEEENRLFFGRQRQINYMLSRLQEDRLIAVVGPSGSGKTSLVLAGLLPEMKQQDKLNGVVRFYFPVISASSRPLEDLNRLFRSPESKLQTEGARKDVDFTDGRQLLNRINEFTELPAVIVIDQFEQVFTRADDGDRRVFLRNLYRVIRTPRAKHIVILIMRDDDFDSFVRRPDVFRRVLEPAKVSLPQMGSLDLRDVIAKPASYVGARFDESTIETLVKDIIGEPIGLPLLQFKLVKLWVYYKQNEDINEAFLTMKPSRDMLADTAEDSFSELDARDRRIVEHVFTKLIRIDSDLTAYGWPVVRSQLYLRTELKSRVDALIDKLATAQLIRIHPGPVAAEDQIEIVHDALIRGWARMASWVRSKRHWRVGRRIAMAAAVAIIIMATLVAIGFFIGKKQQGDQSRDLARLSAKQFNYGRFDLALLLGREAYAVEHNATTKSNLLRLLYYLQSTSHPKMFLFEKDFEVDDLAFSPETETDPGRLATLDSKGNIRIWSLTSKSVLKKLDSGDANSPLVFSPDGKTLLTGSTNPKVRVTLWDLESGNRRDVSLPKETKEYSISALAISSDGRTVFTGDTDGSVIQWDVTATDVKATRLYQHDNVVDAIALTRNGNLLASGSTDGRTILWDRHANGGHRRVFGVRGEVKKPSVDTEYKPIFSLAFNSQGDRLAAGNGDEVFVWDLKDGRQVTEFSSGPTLSGCLVSFSEDGQFLTAYSYDGALIVWDLLINQLVGRQFFKPTATHSAAFSDNGNLLALPAVDGMQVWQVLSDRSLKARSGVNALAFKPTSPGYVLASAEYDGQLSLWDVSSQKFDSPVRKEAIEISSLAFNRNGALLALGLKDGTISLRDGKDYHEVGTLDAGKITDSSSPDQGVSSSSSTEPGKSNEQDPVQQVSTITFDPSPGSERLAAIVGIRPTDDKNRDDDNGKKDIANKIFTWDTTSKSQRDLPMEVNTIATSLAFSPDGRTLAWGSANKEKTVFKIVLWDGKDRQELPSKTMVTSLAFSRQSQILASGSYDGKIFLWNPTTRQQLSNDAIQGAPGRVTDLAFSPDDTILAAATNENLLNSKPGVITLWDLETREPLGNPLVGHHGRISTIAFSADGKLLASGSLEPESQDLFNKLDVYRIILWNVDVADCDHRFCQIIDCKSLGSGMADEINKKSWFQLLYSKMSRWLGTNKPAT